VVAISSPDQFLSRGLLCLGPPLMLTRHGCIPQSQAYETDKP